MITSAALDVDANHATALYTDLKAMPTVAAVNVKKVVRQKFREMMVQFLMVFATVLTIFAIIIAVGVIYNSARVVLSERAWELMSLRVLGFTQREIFAIVRGEIVFSILAALPVGWLLGYGFAALMVWLMRTESYEIPLVVSSQTFAYVSLTVLLSGLVSIFVVRRRLNELQIVSALKVQE